MKSDYEQIDPRLIGFNDKESWAYGAIYDLLYREIFFYTYSLYKDSEVPVDDVIQDVFLALWENKRVNFTNIVSLKAYIITVIKNKFLMYYRHQKFIERSMEEYVYLNDYFISKSFEAEIFAELPQMLNLLPQECADVIQLIIEEYKIKEISEMLNRSESAIYKQRERSIKIIKRKVL